MSDIRDLAREYIHQMTNTLIEGQMKRDERIFNLDEFQRKLLDSQSKFIRVVAPAGTGKTSTLVEKALDVLGCDSDAKVMCLTFTNAAANEFKDRAKKINSSLGDRLKVSTLNSFGLDLVRRVKTTINIVKSTDESAGYLFGQIKKLNKTQKLWEEDKIKYVYSAISDLSDLMKSLGFCHMDKIEKAQQQLELLQRFKMDSFLSEGIDSLRLEGRTKKIFNEKWFPFWRDLCINCYNTNLFTLEDQKYWALNELATNTKLISWFKNQDFTHVFIDEFQDINFLDLYFILQIIHITGASVIIVGDDDQCIYEWRGCTSVMIRYPEMFFGPVLLGKTIDTIILERNYRSPQNIVTHSKNLIGHNSDRIEKRMIPMSQENANIKLIPLPAAYLTLNVVSELVSTLFDEDPDHTVAIVGRKKCQLIPVQILLTRKKIQFAVDSDLNIFTGKAFDTYRHFLELPKIYQLKRPISKIIDDFIALLDKIGTYPLNRDTRESIRLWLSNKSIENLSDAIYNFRYYEGPLNRKYYDPARISENLDRLLSSKSVLNFIQSSIEIFKGFDKDFVKSRDDIFYSDPPFSHLADLAVNYKDDFVSFLFDIQNAISYANSDENNQNKIELMTALRAKGREFDTVIVLDVNDGIWPNKKAIEDNKEEEERRLFYVTITRAKKNLLLFESKRINGERFSVSPYIKEMKLPSDSSLLIPNTDMISKELLSQLRL